ncbi:TRAPP trafficking subunit Trs65-domain-containing protein [Desarmillaria tabescens]|uniref:TRAPP trafficking subunit Trs65-domain-containing protein n=1 Tax=Armillaria tabescens TaxID=1929756 RepID=A0AA39NPN5_ARMTA|nr:TRAPP trafficking subunit Trs65-domain-containing protein [Desarmillaria tabescens]KAK0469510.1 TRAPP trafficking subunit Trs65-domain-containing protein [Desarmillaria tabescens]
MSSSFEQLFGSAVLNVVVPDTSVEYPPSASPDDWLSRLKSPSSERKLAFFDEQMNSYLTVRLSHLTSFPALDTQNPPQELLMFLAHLQISLEAAYISSVPIPDPSNSVRLSAPPRLSKMGPRHHPSIFPPSTPNPTPAVAENDRRYLNSEKTTLLTSIWGQGAADDSLDAFSLLWSEAERAWMAVYRLSFTIAFIRLTYADPLLCLTVSTTLREKPLALSQPKNPLTLYLSSLDNFIVDPTTPTTATTPVTDRGHRLGGFEEVNMLEGLTAGPTFSVLGVSLPTSRLGSDSRQKLFCLPPISPVTPTVPTPSPLTATRTAHPTLRKSFRKTLNTVSGFRVRMRTVFVPAVLLPEVDVDQDEERERREAGNEERTVVLCLEVENTGETDLDVGFSIEKVDVKVGGEGAKAVLIGWDDGQNKGDAVFPLSIASREQYNLLYAVSFLRSPEEVLALTSLSVDAYGKGEHSDAQLQRSVTINIFGTPYMRDSQGKHHPTNTFVSRWNCVLDLSTQKNRAVAEPGLKNTEVLPEPPSPFPVTMSSTTPRRGSLGTPYRPSTPPLALADVTSKRHTLPYGGLTSSRLATRLSSPSPTPSQSSRSSTPNLVPPRSSSYSPLPPSMLQIPRSPTTYEPPPPPPPDTKPRPPTTPAYPAFPQSPALPLTPVSQAPLASQAHIGPSVDIPRERGAGIVPPTPGPIVYPGEDQGGGELQHSQESIVVSVGLLSVSDDEGEDEEDRRIYPMGKFTLDIFVYNRSRWTRRFEVSCPDRRNRRRKGDKGNSTSISGVLPLENRVRIGPLLPTACQSVRMKFLALAPGVHTIEILTLTDTESGFSTDLKHVPFLTTLYLSLH